KPAEKSGSAEGNVDAALDAISGSLNRGISIKTYPTKVIPTGANGEYTASELYEAVNDTIVLIKVYTDINLNSRSYDYYDYYFGFGEKPEESKKSSEPVYSGYGSGIVFTDDGYILTNAHVVDGAAKLVVEVNDYDEAGKTYEYDAEVIGADTSSDIAVIKIKRDEPFIAATIGDSDSLKVGQSIGVIGNPGVNADIMFSHTMTTGIVSGLDVEGLADNCYSLSLIQTDAAITSGNSGGGMFDMYGNVVGVVNSKIIATTYEGIGFALTINEAKPIMQDLLTYGYVKSRPVLGITTVELTEYRAELYGAKLSKGLLVTAMNDGAPVEKSGLKIADIITKINGKNVETVRDVQTIIGKLRIGDKVTATVARVNGIGGVDSIDVDIELTESQSK
ncbi:MAG: trypsin-like peptidase domain-containing protein, partial [Ruminiclostridium sp.]|nr:trypsin-like peptidase domain-containing protein [Ruminiclostridium sp.]